MRWRRWWSASRPRWPRPRGSAAASSSASRRKRSQLDLRADLDHAVGRQGKEIGGRPRVAREESEEELAPLRHPGALDGAQRLAAQVEAGVGFVDRHALRLAESQHAEHVRALLEAEVGGHAPEALAEALDAHLGGLNHLR